MRIKKATLSATLGAIITFLATFYVMPYFIYGDQFYYREFYESCLFEGYSFEQQFFCYQSTLGSLEPLYFYLSKFSNYLGFSKDLFIAIANTIFAYYLIKLTFKYYGNFWHRYLFSLLLITNFYLIIVFFTAERLKFGLLFITIAMLTDNKKRLFYFFTAMVAHVQSAIMIMPFYIYKVFDKKTSLLFRVITIVSASALMGAVFYLLRNHIASKAEAYGSLTDNIGIYGVLKTSVFIVLAAISTKKLQPIIIGLPIIISSYFLGSDRVGMLAFILYVSYVIYEKRKADLVLFLIMIYFSYRGIDFILNILNTGNGFV